MTGLALHLATLGFQGGAGFVSHRPLQDLGHIACNEHAIRLITSPEDFSEHVYASSAVCCVKFTAPHCRGCKALKPKFERLFVEYRDRINFFEVEFSSARQIFGQEQVRRTPSVLVYCGDVGRVGGFACVRWSRTPTSG